MKIAELTETEELDLISYMEDNSEPVEEPVKETDAFYYWNRDTNKLISSIANQLQRMGFELSKYEEDGKHEYLCGKWKRMSGNGEFEYAFGKWRCTLNPKSTCIRLDYKQTTGKYFSECVISYLDYSAKDIVNRVADLVFNKDV